MHIHRWLDFKITRRCNNHGRKCDYCSVPVDPPSAPELLELTTVHQTLLDARSLGFDTFWFLGGEPTLREDAAELFDPLSDDTSVMLTVVTNGKQANAAMYEALFDTQARRACVQVSLDTLVHDNLKHVDPDSSLSLIADLSRLASDRSGPIHTCQVEVHTVISRENLDDFDDFVRSFGVRGIPVSLAMVCPWTIVPEPVSFNEFTANELLAIANKIDGIDTGLDIDHFNRSVAEFIRAMLSPAERQMPRTCGAGLTHVVINGDGSTYRCMADSFKPETAIGNICRERLHTMLHRVPNAGTCVQGPECFDGFAWDRFALSA